MPPSRPRTLDRWLSRCGVSSRTEAAARIAEGRVRVNGAVARDPGTWIDPGRDAVTLDGLPVEPRSGRRVVLFNKPRGVLVTARDPEGRPTVGAALPPPFAGDPALRPVGRLDGPSGGLLLFTDDTDLAAAILGAGSGVAKVYRVKVSPAPDPAVLETLRRGVEIGDPTATLPARVDVERPGARSAVLRFEIVEGRNRQIRRMVAAVGGRVDWLVRVAIGPLELGDLAVGAAREASPAEVSALLDAAGLAPDRPG